MTDLEKTNTVRKKMKKRSTIGWTLFALLVGLAFFDFITYTIVLMLSFPMMAIIIVLNARVDTIVEHNDQRLFVLGVTLALVSFTAYSGQLQKNVQENNALEHCYQYAIDKSMCDEMSGILNPEPMDFGE